MEQSLILPSKLDHITSTPVHGRNSVSRSPTGKRKRTGSVQCLRCDKSINLETDLFYTCSVCGLDVCLQCTGIPHEIYTSMQELGENCFMWSCKGCKQNFPTINNVSESLQTIDKKNDKRLTHLENKIDNLDGTINKKINEGIADLKINVIEEVSDSIKENLRQEVRAEVREIESQKARILNLIVFNLQESDLTNSEDRQREDIQNFKSICSSIGVEVDEVPSAFRLGNRIPGRNRPLKVIMGNRQLRKAILDSARDIKTKAQKQFDKVIIVKDLTPRQREENKKRRQANNLVMRHKDMIFLGFHKIKATEANLWTTKVAVIPICMIIKPLSTIL